MNDGKINVLVADDSSVARLLLVHLLESDPQIQVIGIVNDGQAALDFVSEQRPDVIVMDIHMPHLDGFEAARLIMETQPVPIVICTATTNPDEVVSTLRLMEAGAVACVAKPVAHDHANFTQLVANLLQTVKLMSEVKVVRRWPKHPTTAAPVSLYRRGEARREAAGVTIIGVGASTGGPPVLQTIFAALPKDFPVPFLVVQHIAAGFLQGLAEWLSQTTGWQVQIATDGLVPLPGHVYLAPDNLQMALGRTGRIALTRDEPESGLRPSVSFLFRSLAEVAGPSAVGILLTGMGKDGAEELRLLKKKGAITIAQDKESSVVHGMPGEAIQLDAATHVLSPEAIAEALINLVERKPILRGNEP